MKIIHTADLHLESKMGVNFGKAEAAKRRNELLFTFERLAEEASKKNIKIIIIAGDMFDTKSLSKKSKDYILNIFKNHSDIDFIYTSGNHDESNFFFDLEELPSNFKMFDNEWKTYSYDDLDITGINYNEKTDMIMYDTLNLDKQRKNIVVLHGQISTYKSEGCINLNQLMDKGIDYLALGHIHSYKYSRIDERGIWAYSGCLEPRGFDELGEKGYVLIDTEDITNPTFIKFSMRTCHEISVDINGLVEWMDITNKVMEEVKNIPNEDLIHLTLVGEYNINLLKRVELLKEKLSQKFFSAKVKDKTKLAIDIETYKGEISLKSEFIQKVLSSDLDDETKQIVLEMGIKALLGDDIHDTY